MEHRKVAELTIHPLLKDAPMLAPDHPDVLQIIESIETDGFTQPIRITEHNHVIDGRHRKMAAEMLGLAEVPVSVVPEADAVSVIMRSELARKHLSKWQIAYMLGPVFEPFVRAGKTRKLMNLREGKTSKNANDSRKSHADAFGTTPFEERLAEMGISRATWFRVQEVRARLHENPKLRARFEPLLFHHDPEKAMTLEAVNKAIGSLTGAKSAGDDLKNARAQHQKFIAEAFARAQKHFEFWDDLGKQNQEHVKEVAVHSVACWPRDLQMVVYQELRAKLKG